MRESRRNVRMSHVPALMVDKLKGSTIILVAAKHNKRTDYAKTGEGRSIDPSRTHLNQSLLGHQTPKAISENARKMMEAAGITALRKDAVRAIEFVTSLPLNHGIDADAFFRAVLAWIAARYGGIANVLSADVHHDEPHLHMHVLLLPLVAGRMNGSDALGGPAQMKAMHRAFESEVAVPLGLSRRIPKLIGGKKIAAASLVREFMKRAQDPAMLSPAWPVIQAHIVDNPEPYLTALNIDAPTEKPKRARSFTDYGISKGKGPKVERGSETISRRDWAPNHMLCRVRSSSGVVQALERRSNSAHPSRSQQHQFPGR